MNDIFIVPLTNSFDLCLIDTDSVETVMKFKWLKLNTGYFRKTIDSAEFILLHNHLLNSKGTDHKNRLKFDNRLSNLRPANKKQNACNRSKSANCSSKYKGVSWNKGIKRWTVCIKVNRIKYHIGTYKNEEEAARAYDEGAKKHFKEFALLNFPANTSDTI